MSHQANISLQEHIYENYQEFSHLFDYSPQELRSEIDKMKIRIRRTETKLEAVEEGFRCWFDEDYGDVIWRLDQDRMYLEALEAYLEAQG